MILLVSIGILMMYSTSSTLDVGAGSSVFRQFIYALVGLVFFLGIIFLNYKVILHFSFLLYLFLIFLLLITFVLGIETRGSVRWIDLKFFTLQASEVAKPILVLVLSSFFVRFSPRKWRNIGLSFLIILLPAFFIFKEPDLGSALVLIVIWLGLLYLSGLKIRDLVILCLVIVISIPLGFHFLKDYQKDRLFTFLNPTSDPLGSGYNLVQSIIAVGSGQVTGRGFGRGTQSHLNFLPEQKTDFIFATSAEELGFVGIALIIILFAILITRILRIASRAENKVGKLICYGSVIVISTQLFVNAGMNMGLVPVTGITLPFISFGGSSLISMIILLALVQSVHINNHKNLSWEKAD